MYYMDSQTFITIGFQRIAKVRMEPTILGHLNHLLHMGKHSSLGCSSGSTGQPMPPCWMIRQRPIDANSMMTPYLLYTFPSQNVSKSLNLPQPGEYWTKLLQIKFPQIWQTILKQLSQKPHAICLPHGSRLAGECSFPFQAWRGLFARSKRSKWAQACQVSATGSSAKDMERLEPLVDRMIDHLDFWLLNSLTIWIFDC